MSRLYSKSGFTLVELAITSAIILMLVSLAMPTFQRLRYRAREAEAASNLYCIKTSQECYRGENGSYLPCTASPNSVPVAETIDWTDNGGFTTLGFEPDGRVRYQYEVDAPIPSEFTATATGDLDGNGDNAILQVTNDTNVVKVSDRDVF